MRVLLTGGTGFLGTNFYQWLKRKEPDIDIMLFSRRTGHDVRNYADVEREVAKSHLVIHMAAQTHVDFSLHRELEAQHSFISTNVNGTLNVIHACRKHKVKLIHISTSEVYGSNQNKGRPMKEEHPILAQAGIYATSKACADLTCRMSFLTEGDETVVVRPFNLWGCHQSVEKFIPRIVNLISSGEKVTIYGDGEQRRDYVFAPDACEAIWLAKDLPAGTTVNIATERSYSVNEVVRMVGSCFPNRIVKPANVEPRPAEVRELIGSYRKLNKLTGWKPTTYLSEETIKSIVQWYLANGAIQQPNL